MKQENNILNPKDIHLIKINSKITLFLHNETLQIYPIFEDELLMFLKKYKKLGAKTVINNYENQQILNFVSDKIINAPLSISVKRNNIKNKGFTTIVLPIAATCNLACPYCFAQSENGFNYENFTEKDVDSIVTFLIDKNKNSNEISIVFFGGEPLLNLNIIKYTITLFKEKYHKYNVHYSITSNGTIFNDEIIQIFKDNNFAVLISLDGYDNEFNLRKFKSGKSSVEVVLNNVEKLKINGIYHEFRATLINNNPYIVETYNFFEKLKTPFTIVFAYTSENKSHNYAKYDETNLKNISKQFDELLKYYVSKIKVDDKIYDSMLIHYNEIISFRIKKYINCSAGINFFTITSNGDIFSCTHFMNEKKYRLGNIEKFIIKKSKYIPVPIKNISFCEKCWAKNFCLGGCTSQKISMGRKSNEPMIEEYCELEKIKIQFYLKLYYFINEIKPNYFKNEINENKI
jgi:radical SAM protein with 4Fe4S-binding SPASM domain